MSRRLVCFCQCHVVWHPGLIYVTSGVFCRRYDALRRFANVVLYAVQAPFGFVTLCVDFKVSRIAYRGWFTLYLQYFVSEATTGVVTLGFDLPASCLVAYRCSWTERQASRHSASFCQRFILWLSWDHVRYIWTLESASWCSASFM
jgi:hypothetical protein